MIAMIFEVLAVASWLMGPSQANAAESAQPNCPGIMNTTARLACYDAAAKAAVPAIISTPTAAPVETAAPATKAPATAAPPLPAATAQAPATPIAAPASADPSPATDAAAEPPEATTKDMLAAIPAGSFKTADPADLHVAPRKFVGKPVEMRHLHCYYADVGDYRCLAPGFAVVTVFTPSIEPVAERTRIEDDCGAMKAMATPKCERTLHFVLDDFEEDHPNALSTRIVLKPLTVIVVPVASAKKHKS